jgi:ketosteroid isomerase-like protein
MERAAALLLIADLHAAQNAFYARGDDSELRKLLSPDIEWTVPGRNAIAGRCRGPTEVLGYIAADATLRTRPSRCTAGMCS